MSADRIELPTIDGAPTSGLVIESTGLSGEIRGKTQKREMTGTLINLMGKILLRYIHVSNYHIAHFKYLTTLFVNNTSIKLKR